MDLVYTSELTEHVGVFVHGGYAYKITEIDAYLIDADDEGFVYSIGAEAAMGHDSIVVASMNTEGSKELGDSLFDGVMCGF